MKIKKLTQNQKTAIMSLVYPLFSLAIILALWAFTAWRTDSELIIPSVGRTFEEVWKLLSQQGGQPWIDIDGAQRHAGDDLAVVGLAARHIDTPRDGLLPPRRQQRHRKRKYQHGSRQAMA